MHQPALPQLFSEQIAEELNEFFKQEDWEASGRRVSPFRSELTSSKSSYALPRKACIGQINAP